MPDPCCEVCGIAPVVNAVEGSDLPPRYLCVEIHGRLWGVYLAAESYLNVLRKWTGERRPSLQSVIDSYVANTRKKVEMDR